MIKNEKQYKITRKLLAEWESNLTLLRTKPLPDTPAWLYQEQLHAAEAEIEKLQAQVDEYEALRSGEYRLMDLQVVRKLPQLLIGWRIKNHLTHKQLADRLGLHENQIQKYESENYRCASLETIAKIAQVLEEEARK